MGIVFLIPGDNICCVNLSLLSLVLPPCTSSQRALGQAAATLHSKLSVLGLSKPSTFSFSSLQMCSSAQPSWWPFTELIPSFQCRSCTGGPKTGCSIYMWVIILFYSGFINFPPSIACVPVNTVQVVIDLLWCQDTKWLMFSSLPSNTPQGLFSRAASQIVSPWPVPVCRGLFLPWCRTLHLSLLNLIRLLLFCCPTPLPCLGLSGWQPCPLACWQLPSFCSHPHTWGERAATPLLGHQQRCKAGQALGQTTCDCPTGRVWPGEVLSSEPNCYSLYRYCLKLSLIWNICKSVTCMHRRGNMSGNGIASLQTELRLHAIAG